jgi:hypothetical protein
MKYIVQRTLEEILQDFFFCEQPFNEDGSLTEDGSYAYEKLTTLLYDVGNLTSTNVNDIVETLDIICNETP